MRCQAPAKLNLNLHVLGRRADGYHELESVFLPLDLADELTLELDADAAEPGVVLRVHGDAGELGDPQANLAARAGRAFLAAAGAERARLEIELTKRIPVGAGLGGGSSDAAAVLRGLAELLPGQVSGAEISELALELGADVPFFLDPRPALVEGIGERVTPLAGVPALWLVLANPGISLDTAQVYKVYAEQAGALTGARAGPTLRARLGLSGPAGKLGDTLLEVVENDLEAAAQSLCPAIAELKQRLASLGAQAVGMSGSGATVFGIFRSQRAALEALDRAAFPPPVRIWLAATVGS